jgi:hypothetical protein
MENYLGESKYDGKIRRVTLIKKVADKLDMHDGDMLSYWEIGNEIVIRKVKKDSTDYSKDFDIIPVGTPLEEIKMISAAAFDIADYFVSTRNEPSGVEMIEITEKASRHFPDSFSKEKRGDMLKMSIELAKNVVSKTSVIDPTHEEDE